MMTKNKAIMIIKIIIAINVEDIEIYFDSVYESNEINKVDEKFIVE